MIDVSVTLSQESVIETLRVTGHSGFALKDSDVVCAAATVLLRTFLKSVEAEQGIEWSSSGLAEGCLQFVSRRVSSSVQVVYQAWSWFLLRGLEDLAKEFPQNVVVVYRKTSGRLFHGT